MPVYHLSFYRAKDRYIIISKTSRWTFKGPREAKCNAVKSNLGRLRTTGGRAESLSPPKETKVTLPKVTRARLSVQNDPNE